MKKTQHHWILYVTQVYRTRSCKSPPCHWTEFRLRAAYTSKYSAYFTTYLNGRFVITGVEVRWNRRFGYQNKNMWTSSKIHYLQMGRRLIQVHHLLIPRDLESQRIRSSTQNEHHRDRSALHVEHQRSRSSPRHEPHHRSDHLERHRDSNQWSKRSRTIKTRHLLVI